MGFPFPIASDFRLAKAPGRAYTHERTMELCVREIGMRVARLLLCLTVAGLTAARGAEGLKEWEVTCDPPANGKMIMTIRLAPAETRTIDQLVVDCPLRQDFARKDSSGKVRVRSFEAATFTYRESDVRLVEDLDRYIGLRVPIGKEELAQAYGDRTFFADAPVSIPRIRITALVKGEPVWSVEGPTRGVNKPTRKASLLAPPAAAPSGALSSSAFVPPPATPPAQKAPDTPPPPPPAPAPTPAPAPQP